MSYDRLNWFEVRLRRLNFLYQKITRGFSDDVTWDIHCDISKFVLPRLKRYKELTNGYPGGLDEQQWNEILDKMIYAFERIVKNDEWDFVKYPPDYDFGWTTKQSITHPEYDEAVFNDDRKPDYTEFDEVQKKIQEGLDLFAKYYRNLWW